MPPIRGATWGRWLLLGLVASVGLLPMLPLSSAACPPLSVAERAIEPWFALHCHRDPSRTLSVAGVLLAVCARCAGLYFGLGLGALVRRPPLSPRALRAWVGLGALLMLVDVLVEARGWHGPHAELRALTGLLLGYPVGVGLGRAIVRAPASAHKP